MPDGSSRVNEAVSFGSSILRAAPLASLLESAWPRIDAENKPGIGDNFSFLKRTHFRREGVPKADISQNSPKKVTR
jgi:hypothetical protein